MPEPFEIMAVPFDAFLAPAGTAKPDIDIDPAPPWKLLAKRGAAEYDEGGITVTHGQSVNVYRGLRGTGGVKAFRTSETLTVGLTLNDLSLEEYARILNDAVVTDGGASRTAPIHQGPQVATYALLLKSPDGPYGDGLPIQLWVPKVYQSGSPAVVHRKGTPAGLALVFEALEDLEADADEDRFGLIEARDIAVGS